VEDECFVSVGHAEAVSEALEHIPAHFV
jgi:hypothetical protein